MKRFISIILLTIFVLLCGSNQTFSNLIASHKPSSTGECGVFNFMKTIEIKTINGVETKKCCKCEKDLPVKFFGKSNKTKCGLRGECRECRYLLKENKKIFTTIINLQREYEGLLYIEEWKPIIGWDNYEISSFGRVKSLKREITENRGSRIKADFIKSLRLNHKGYYRTTFYKIIDGKEFNKQSFIHRLVAIHFIPNPLNKPEVNHIKGIKTDNFFRVLEWATSHENTNHAYQTGLKRSYKWGFPKQIAI